MKDFSANAQKGEKMLTIDKLREFGANVDEGIARCMGKEDFYLMLVGKVTSDTRIYQLEKQLEEKDLGAAFESAHALKGLCANLSLVPITKPVSEMTELLRKKTDTDYTALMTEAKMQFERLCDL